MIQPECRIFRSAHPASCILLSQQIEPSTAPTIHLQRLIRQLKRSISVSTWSELCSFNSNLRRAKSSNTDTKLTSKKILAKDILLFIFVSYFSLDYQKTRRKMSTVTITTPASTLRLSPLRVEDLLQGAIMLIVVFLFLVTVMVMLMKIWLWGQCFSLLTPGY